MHSIACVHSETLRTVFIHLICSSGTLQLKPAVEKLKMIEYQSNRLFEKKKIFGSLIVNQKTWGTIFNFHTNKKCSTAT